MTDRLGLPGTDRLSQDAEFAVLKLGKFWANWDESVIYFGSKRSKIVGGGERRGRTGKKKLEQEELEKGEPDSTQECT